MAMTSSFNCQRTPAAHWLEPSMSNGGLRDVLGERLLRSAVGDANVAAEMDQSGAIVGAEPSGHADL